MTEKRCWNAPGRRACPKSSLRVCFSCQHHSDVIAGNLEEAKEALALTGMDERLYSTVGVHPTRCSEFLKEDADKMMKDLIEIGKKGKAMKKIVAVGEFGLDYDRLHFTDKEVRAELLVEE